MEEKRLIRNRAIESRDALSETERFIKSRQIFGQVYSMEEYKKAEKILVYASFRSEVGTEDFIEKALKDGKEIYCPKVCGGDMEFYRIAGLKELTPGYMGIKEPEGTDGKIFHVTGECRRNTLMIMPGSAFDKERNRIGYGGGYYDRYLARYPFLITIAVGFSCQICESVPTDVYDRKPDIIITEEEVIKIAKAE